MSGDMFLPKAQIVKNNLSKSIKEGQYGPGGSPFLTTRGLAEHKSVSLKTAHRIMKMLREEKLIELEGKRSIIAKKLKIKKAAKSSLIGVMVTNLENPFFASLVKEIEKQAATHDLDIMLASNHYELGREEEILGMFLEKGVRGVLACPWEAGSEFYGNYKTPLVFMARRVEGSELDSVLVHNFSAGEQVARHFIENGFRKFAYLGLNHIPHDQRLSGFKQELSRNGFSLPVNAVFHSDVNSIQGDIESLEDFLLENEEPVAVFCFHDLLAASLLRQCREYGLKVPRDVAVAGFDNLPLAAELSPSLTTVAYPIEQMAVMAIERLCARMNGDDTRPMQMYVEAELIERESSRGINCENFFELDATTLQDLVYHSS